MAISTPSSQTTAPVHEFRCLYTRDLHKKSKKWHDGSVRFHTFNRRVMAYDDTRTFIDDVHYRQEEEFAEGMEIRLDRGVLVEVGERLGQTQTDLGPILDRGRADKALSPRKQHISLANRSQAIGSSQRPKSLIEVLGPSQGRSGRARGLYQSPYDQRYTPARGEQAGPSPKRPRLSSDKENYSHEGHPPIRPARPSLPQPTQPSKPITHSSRGNEPPIEFEEVLDLSADEEPRRHPPKRLRSTEKFQKIHKEASKNPTLTSGISYPRSTSLVRPVDQGVQAGKEKGSGKKLQYYSNSNKSTISPHPIASRSPSTKTARLLLSRPKTRQKLTCTLPFSPDPSTAKPIDPPFRRSPCQETVGRSLSPTGKALHLDNDDHAVAIDPTLPTQWSKCQSSTREQQLSPHHGNSSPLFMPEDNADPTPPSPCKVLTQDQLAFSDVGHSQTFEDLDEVCISLRSAPAGGTQTSPRKRAETEGGNGLSTRVEPEPQDEADSPPAVGAEDHEQSQSLQDSEETTVEGVNETVPKTLPAVDDMVKSGGQETPAEPETRSAPNMLVTGQRQTEAGKGVGHHEQAATRRPPQLPINNVHQPFTSRVGGQSSVPNQPTPAMGPTAGVQGRSFRRVFSENDALDEEDLAPVPRLEVSNPRRRLGLLENLTTKRSSAKSRSPTKMQRCASDTLAFDTADRSVTLPAAEGPQGLTGPWTVDEAFLLFDWWPAEMEKPVYWMDAPVEPVSRAPWEPAHSNWGGITTARQFLRDETT
ncbi:hypothetical protein A1O7_03119 [Cladophialophora yegresii CBS 114405]|uniref:5'-3' DNA helicase ZGRF1-like N-terminal domain-containing protein n=1 Tax=Cladophialophora yegresii CBS 114405 TaxID=1182544 RepID=W9WDP3_9EURO|nr:uncharacterized protein A1O7_03119 [Cladophialophora yegresii CBS 114405]EXJ62681.1 hypothetical protein A1O7_03119 [Cladophialophora yegresii CBS 114405]